MTKADQREAGRVLLAALFVVVVLTIMGAPGWATAGFGLAVVFCARLRR